MPFQLTAPGRHAACLRNRRAGDAPAFGLPAERLRPCSQLNGLLVRREARYELVR